MTHKEIRIEGVLILGILINRLRSDCIESATCIWINLIKESTRKLFTWDSTKELDENKRHNKLTNQPSSPTWEVEMNFLAKLAKSRSSTKLLLSYYQVCRALPSWVLSFAEFCQVMLSFSKFYFFISRVIAKFCIEFCWVSESYPSLCCILLSCQVDSPFLVCRFVSEFNSCDFKVWTQLNGSSQHEPYKIVEPNKPTWQDPMRKTTLDLSPVVD